MHREYVAVAGHGAWLAVLLLLVRLFLKILSGMANSVDPDQTAPAGAV